MTTAEMRLHVQAMYPNSAKWREKVSCMDDFQVYAIYKRIQATTREVKKISEKVMKTTEPEQLQLDI